MVIVAFLSVPRTVFMVLVAHPMSVSVSQVTEAHCVTINVHLENGANLVKWIACVKMELLDFISGKRKHWSTVYFNILCQRSEPELIEVA